MRKPRVLQMLSAVALMMFPNRKSRQTVAMMLQARAAHPRDVDRVMLRYGDRTFTYGEANRCANRVAHAYRALGLQKGDVIALIMENRPEYLWHYLGAGKLGIAIALINPTARADSLVHAIVTVDPARIVVGSEAWPRFAEIQSRLTPTLAEGVWLEDEADNEPVGRVARFRELTESASDDDPISDDPPRLSDLGAYVYTSGTTGMPKAARMSYYRLTNVSRAMGSLAWRMEPDDVIYCCLPLYHSNAVVTAVGCTIAEGAALVLARRFSARSFWDDLVHYQATGFNYIGEMCRYLLNAPPVEAEARHRVHTVVGQGLRPDVWRAFQRRFGIARIVEFYASTEGNIATVNLGGTVGSVGKLLFGGRLVRWDGDRQDVVRRADGRLVPCRRGEPGLLLGRIRKHTPFEGYRDRAATAAKIISGAFRPGDAWYNTGDLFRMDGRRNLTFVDRVGDTYRYKGENVATFEVEAQIGKWRPVALVNVYGVQIDGIEGRVGAASLVLRPCCAFDPLALAEHVDATLPPYARPVFVRLLGALETTDTFKLKKGQGLRHTLDPGVCREPVYFRAGEMSCYERLTAMKYREIAAGRVRL